MIFIEGKFEFGRAGISRRYVPSHVAHALQMHDLVKLPEPTPSPGLLMANGRIGGVSNGGAIILAGQEWGSDYVAAEGDSKKVYLLPSEKDAVEVDRPEENIGTVKESGMGILSHEGLIVVSGIVTFNPWRAEQASQRGARVAQVAPHLWSVVAPFPMRAEITDIDPSGVTTAIWLPS